MVQTMLDREGAAPPRAPNLTKIRVIDLLLENCLGRPKSYEELARKFATHHGVANPDAREIQRIVHCLYERIPDAEKALRRRGYAFKKTMASKATRQDNLPTPIKRLELVPTPTEASAFEV